MNSDDKKNFSRRMFLKLAAGTAATAALSKVPDASPEGTLNSSQESIDREHFDVVIVGSGCAGALTAYELSKAGLSVLVLEAGMELRHPADKVETYYAENAKIPESPWLLEKYKGENRANHPVDHPIVLDMASKKVTNSGGVEVEDWKRKDKYLIQKGEDDQAGPFNSTYVRIGGGTLNHWQGITLRHVPNDFQLKTKYSDKATDDDVLGKEFQSSARDWPISYEELEPWYCKAEHEVGVAGASKAYENYLGARRSQDFPMKEIALSYLDERFKERVNHQVINGRRLNIFPIPQARNSEDREGRPKCQGNSSCIPICPIQAKYDATVHLKKAKAHGAEIRYQSVAYRVEVDHENYVSGIKYKLWSEAHVKEKKVTARIYVLAAHAIETAKLLLISRWKGDGNGNIVAVANSSDQVGRNLMDHIIYIAWGLAQDPVYPYRGPQATAGIGDFRDKPGDELDDGRIERAAYRIGIGNDGLSWPIGPENNTSRLLSALIDRKILDLTENEDQKGMMSKQLQMNMKQMNAMEAMFSKTSVDRQEKEDPKEKEKKNLESLGDQLRASLGESMKRHVRLGSELEGLPLPDSRITVGKIGSDGSFDQVPLDEKDALGIPKPQVQYRISEYTKKGFVESVETLHQILRKVGVDPVISSICNSADLSPDETRSHAKRTIEGFTRGGDTSGVFEYEGKLYEYRGAGHIMGTYRMGKDSEDSVCNKDCRSWDHQNLFLLGSGVFPSSGTANPTLTIMALALRAADIIARELKS